MRRADTSKITLSIYDYLNYRQFLKELAHQYKEKKPGFKLTAFAEKAGIKSPGMLKMVIDGDRRLTAEMRDAFCQAFEIRGREKIYFAALVEYNQTFDPDKKRDMFETLQDLRPRAQKFVMQKHHFRYLTRDYYVTIREMVTLSDFREDYACIAARCAPPISASEAKEAVDTLLELGFLARDEHGKLKQAQGHVKTTDHNTQAAEAYHFHDAVLSKARYALSYLDQAKRSYQSLTISLPKTLVDEVVAKYYSLRDWIVEKSNAMPQADDPRKSPAGDDASESPAGDEVYQINFQMFPATWKEPSNAPKPAGEPEVGAV